MSIFPKYYSHLDPHGLAALVREVGLDTTNAVIRDGFWVSAENLAAELPAFVRAMRQEGLEVRFATTGFAASSLADDPTPLSVMADNGITDFRLDYFRVSEGNVRASLESARADLQRLAPVCEKAGIRAVYQVHQGTLVTSASAAWNLVSGLPPEWIGVELDPGNQSFEGFEQWDRSARLLGGYLAALAVKDTVLVREPERADEPGKGWKRSWAPIYEGVTNWYDVMAALKTAEFAGTFVFMPFYLPDDPVATTAKLKREVAYLRGTVLRALGD